jgi:peptidoglycan hydrolase-like protein with peptidoglycan-binding domain
MNDGPMHEHPVAGKGPMTGTAEPGGSPWVNAIQASLNRAEHAHLAVDGKMDTATHAALKRFQKTQGLQMTGRVNKATWRALGL